MSTIGLNRRINSFIEGKQREMPELRDKDVDELLEDLIKDGRTTSAY